MKSIKVMIADDHMVLLQGLQLMLSGIPGFDVVATASNGAEVLMKMKSYYVDVLVMDIQMPHMNGFETVQEMVRHFPDTRILILSMHSERVYIEKMYRLGVSGYLLKSAGKEEITTAIRKVAEGKTYFSDDVSAAILLSTTQPSTGMAELTKREKEILLLIAQEHNNPTIAEKLFLSLDTVKTHRKNLMRKLGINNTAGLVKYAMEHIQQ